jgi:hypothetical protein
MNLPPKKKPWYKRMIPSCGKSKDTLATNGANGPVVSSQSVSCGNCRKPVSVQSSQTAFVCPECHRVNRVSPVDANGYRRVSVVTDAEMLGGEGKIGLTRTASTTFQTAEDIQIDPSTLPKDPVLGSAIVPQCTVCMDGPGDIVIHPCCHGGICEPCAKHICKNLSVGGSHCPKCRKDIGKILRLADLFPTGKATGVVVDVPMDQVRSGPPKVPPPPGQNKAKN